MKKKVQLTRHDISEKAYRWYSGMSLDVTKDGDTYYLDGQEMGTLKELEEAFEAYQDDVITPDQWDAIASYMDDEIRESVHVDLAPCTQKEFLREYLNRDPSFEALLADEFGISVGDLR